MTATPPQGGTTANTQGTALERFIRHWLRDKDYTEVPQARFIASRTLEQPISARRFYVGRSIYETQMYCDFILYHPEKWRDNLIIESKWQQVGGSVDEKYPFLVSNIQTRYPCPTILLLDGGGYKQGAERWIRGQAGHGNLVRVFNMQEFQTWANRGGI